jgi:hypothetical protein
MLSEQSYNMYDKTSIHYSRKQIVPDLRNSYSPGSSAQVATAYIPRTHIVQEVQRKSQLHTYHVNT